MRAVKCLTSQARAACLLPLVALLFAAGCHRGAKGERPGPVMVIGMDALDWNVLQPLLDAGKMPHFASLIAGSATGDLQTLIPLAQSPAIWTTISTGVFPERHGVTGFLREDAQGTPVTSETRKVKAIWNILGAAGRRIGLVGWLVTWPCEAVNGYMVSDYLQYNYGEIDRFRGQTYPEALFERVKPFVVKREDLPQESLERFLDLRPGDEQERGFAVALEDLRWTFAADETFARVGTVLLREDPPDFFGIYFRGPDAVCHKYWGMRDIDPSGPRRSAFTPTVDRYYEYMDEVLGRLLPFTGEDWTVFVISDHGYKGATVLEDGSLMLGVGSHRIQGVLIARGPNIRRGVRIEGAAVEDITPTLLYLHGLPMGRDMAGEPLWSLFEPEFRKAHPPRFIETYETGEAAARPAVDAAPVDEALKQRLRSLGYLQ